MKKFFRIEWEGEDDIDEAEVSLALSSWFDRHYDVRNPPIEEIEAFEISDKVFEKDTCSVTTKHNYQPPICVNCGKEKPKKVERLRAPQDNLTRYCEEMWDKINELIEVVNRLT